ncbi:P-type ATPase exporting cations (probably Ca2+) [Candidatus Phytoplasma mali]|uniref:P-type ATPase exporting cations (Probably Ca2+) n=1 Tax=Phytoplasma mali (strain AT) TaxID=482235 RepID=B3QZM1_PHYMT|nr:cation-translocating P-type ATPase [Candidatus Phytoplasma mali]CAP18408.1 P-type ATPase exporting cations (probably Ca2+) [Candidatus Phytoplasma mali]
MKILFAKKNLQELEKILATNIKKGLSSDKAKEKLNLEGKNKLKDFIKTSFWFKLKKQIQNFLVFILLISSFITLIIGFFTKNNSELFEGMLILLIVFFNALLGVFYENKSEKASIFINKKTLSYIKVLRDNKITMVLIENLVKGDVVFLETGNLVPADLRLIETYNLQIEESFLTGENIPIIKNNLIISNKETEILNCKNLVFKNTVVTYGKAKGLVIATGMKTEIGKIISLIQNTKKKNTPLENNINKLGKFLTIIILILIIINTFVILSKHYYLKEISLKIFQNTILTSISLAVAAIPEGLLTIITIILTLGMKKLLDKKTIIKNIRSLESLGATKIICTDKTGTLTENKLKITDLYLYENNYIINKKNILNQNVVKILNYGLLCNNADYDIEKNNENKKYCPYANNPIDQSFIDLGIFFKYDIPNLRNKNIKIYELPFDSKKKLMTTVHQNKEGYFAITKGAPEILLNICKYIDNKGKILIKNNNNLKLFENYLEKMSKKSLRILGLAYQKLNYNFNIKNNCDIQKIEKNLIFLGLISIKDNVKKEAFETIKIFKKAHIITIMITGDNINTAEAIATELKIFDKTKDLIITGDILNKMSEKEFNEKLHLIKVYARTNPENKLKIIDAWQKKGVIVAMIGDGVNDAPSIKKADIGISMGKSGTEISKTASDIIITDDNLLTITHAIKEGRNIFNSMQKSLIFLISCNTGEILAVLINTFFNSFLFSSNFLLLNAVQILWINLITDSLIAIALGIDSKEHNLMKKPPRNIKNNIINKNLILKIILEGIMIGSLTFASAMIGFNIHKNDIINNYKYAQTFAFMVLALSQLVHALNLINFRKSIFVVKPSNYLIKIFIFSCLLQFSTISLTFLKNILNLANLDFKDFLLIIILSLTPLFIIEILKKIKSSKFLNIL